MVHIEFNYLATHQRRLSLFYSQFWKPTPHLFFRLLSQSEDPLSSDQLALWVTRMGNEGDPLIISNFHTKMEYRSGKDENRVQIKFWNESQVPGGDVVKWLDPVSNPLPPSPNNRLPSTTLPTRGVFIPRFSFHQWATCLFSDFAASSAAENNNNEKQKGKTERKKKTKQINSKNIYIIIIILIQAQQCENIKKKEGEAWRMASCKLTIEQIILRLIFNLNINETYELVYQYFG